MVAERLAGLEHDQDGGCSGIRPQYDRRATPARRLDLTQIPALHGAILSEHRPLSKTAAPAKPARPPRSASQATSKTAAPAKPALPLWSASQATCKTAAP